MFQQRVFAPIRAFQFSRTLSALTLALFLATAAATSQPAAAKAPPLATTIVDTGVFAVPDMTSAPIGSLSAETEIELTGEAAPGFLAIYYGDDVAWVPAQFLTIGVRPGIDTAVAIVDTPLLDAPMRDASVVATVPKDAAVILTGASVDGYDAASHDGAGGWINDRDLAR